MKIIFSLIKKSFSNEKFVKYQYTKNKFYKKDTTKDNLIASEVYSQANKINLLKTSNEEISNKLKPDERINKPKKNKDNFSGVFEEVKENENNVTNDIKDRDEEYTFSYLSMDEEASFIDKYFTNYNKIEFDDVMHDEFNSISDNNLSVNDKNDNYSSSSSYSTEDVYEMNNNVINEIVFKDKILSTNEKQKINNNYEDNKENIKFEKEMKEIDNVIQNILRINENLTEKESEITIDNFDNNRELSIVNNQKENDDEKEEIKDKDDDEINNDIEVNNMYKNTDMNNIVEINENMMINHEKEEFLNYNNNENVDFSKEDNSQVIIKNNEENIINEERTDVIKEHNDNIISENIIDNNHNKEENKKINNEENFRDYFSINELNKEINNSNKINIIQKENTKSKLNSKEQKEKKYEEIINENKQQNKMEITEKTISFLTDFIDLKKEYKTRIILSNLINISRKKDFFMFLKDNIKQKRVFKYVNSKKVFNFKVGSNILFTFNHKLFDFLFVKLDFIKILQLEKSLSSSIPRISLLVYNNKSNISILIYLNNNHFSSLLFHSPKVFLYNEESTENFILLYLLSIVNYLKLILLSQNIYYDIYFVNDLKLMFLHSNSQIQEWNFDQKKKEKDLFVNLTNKYLYDVLLSESITKDFSNIDELVIKYNSNTTRFIQLPPQFSEIFKIYEKANKSNEPGDVKILI